MYLRTFGGEQYLGGVIAIARHLSSFCKDISVLSLVGEKREYEGFIKKNVEKNIKLNFINKKKFSNYNKKDLLIKSIIKRFLVFIH